jgi:hypothetical protein
LNPLAKLWITRSSSRILVEKIPKYIKLVEVDVVQVIGSVEDERCFPTLTFMKTKLWSKLTTHLKLVIWIFSQKFFTLQDFPFGEAI